MAKAPRFRGTLQVQPGSISGCDLSRCGLQELAWACDWDCPRLHRLWDLPHELDVEEPVVQACALDRNMVGELEAPLKGPCRDAQIEHFGGFLLGLPRATDRQPVLLCL